MLPGILTRRGPFRLFGSPLRGTMTPYLGPVGLRLDDEGSDLGALIRDCARFTRERWGAHYAEFTLRDPPAEWEHPPGAGWEREHPGSYRLDLGSGEAELWARMKGRGRSAIRKAQRLGVRVVPLRDAALYAQLQAETFARRNTVPTFSRALHQTILDELVPQGLASAWGAEYDGQIIGAGIFIHDDHETHYASGGTLSRFREIPAGYALQWHAITTALQAGQQRYDFGGRGIASIDQFKEAFAPTKIDYWSVNLAPWHIRYAKRAVVATVPYLRRARFRFAHDRAHRESGPARPQDRDVSGRVDIA